MATVIRLGNQAMTAREMRQGHRYVLSEDHPTLGTPFNGRPFTFRFGQFWGPASCDEFAAGPCLPRGRSQSPSSRQILVQQDDIEWAESVELGLLGFDSDGNRLPGATVSVWEVLED